MYPYDEKKNADRQKLDHKFYNSFLVLVKRIVLQPLQYRMVNVIISSKTVVFKQIHFGLLRYIFLLLPIAVVRKGINLHSINQKLIPVLLSESFKYTDRHTWFPPSY